VRSGGLACGDWAERNEAVRRMSPANRFPFDCLSIELALRTRFIWFRIWLQVG
jgi:hypothetical protein